MGSIQEVQDALSAKARTASLDELRSRGRNKVRIIRAEHVAAMVAEAVERAVSASGLIPQTELERLVAESRSEFAEVNRERQREHDATLRLTEELEVAARNSEEADQRVRALEERLGELEGMRMRSAELEPELERAQARLEEAEQELHAHRARVKEHEPELAEAHRRADELRAALEQAHTLIDELEQRIADLESEAETQLAQRVDRREADPATAAQVDVMAQVLEELALLKARVDSTPATTSAAPAPVSHGEAPQPQPNQGVDQIAAALSKLTEGLNNKMEAFGRKMGVSSAVDTGPVQLDALFRDLDDQKVESNLDTLEVKTKQAGGIAANLARLKKLKGN